MLPLYSGHVIPCDVINYFRIMLYLSFVSYFVLVMISKLWFRLRNVVFAKWGLQRRYWPSPAGDDVNILFHFILDGLRFAGAYTSFISYHFLLDLH